MVPLLGGPTAGGKKSGNSASSTTFPCVTGDMTASETRPALPVPTPTEVAGSLPPEAVKYDPENPPVSGSVQRAPEAPAR